jgi:hypothetical protein
MSRITLAAGFFLKNLTVDATGLLLGNVIAAGSEIFIDIAFEFIEVWSRIELE